MPSVYTFRLIVWGILLASVSLSGQELREPSKTGLRVGPFSRTPVLDAPFSATASTVVLEPRPDGTRVRRTATSRMYRDSKGRVRVDYELPAAPPGHPTLAAAPRQMAMLMFDDGRESDAPSFFAYSLDPATRTFRVIPAEFAGWIFNVEWSFNIPAGATAEGVPHFSTFFTADVHAPDGAMPESLGSARIAGVDANGWRVTHAWPVMCRDCDGLGTQTEERWESPDLRVVVFARHLDDAAAVARIYPGKGVEIEYRLTNIVRTEPPAGLFDLPANYVRRTSGPTDPMISFGP
jgi:hypothetical protein